MKARYLPRYAGGTDESVMLKSRTCISYTEMSVQWARAGALWGKEGHGTVHCAMHEMKCNAMKVACLSVFSFLSLGSGGVGPMGCPLFLTVTNHIYRYMGMTCTRCGA